jgi:Ca-activated chloride channel homolog
MRVIPCIACGVVAMLLVLIVTLAVAGQQTFGTRVEQVRVDVLVTENGRAVTGLDLPDFEVTDNGVVQQIDLLTAEQLPLNVVLAVDSSRSTSGERLLHLRIAARAVLTALGQQDRAALLTFNDAVHVPAPLTADLAAVRTALDTLKPMGGTSLVDGAFSAMMVAGTDAGRDLVLVFTDGLDTGSILSGERVLDSARRTDAVVYGVTVGNSGRIGFLKDLTERTGGQSLEVASTVDLQKAFVGILDEFRQRYVLSFTPRGVSPIGWHRLQVRVKGRRSAIFARQGYTAGS